MIVHQSITIHCIRINGLSNSSVLQIGTAGVVKSLSNLYNTGGFTEPAPEAGAEAEEISFVPFRANHSV
jgi:spore germination protein PB